ncbi:MAG: hypothetical protein U1F37_11805 [Alphaproteobacteria bacterium]
MIDLRCSNVGPAGDAAADLVLERAERAALLGHPFDERADQGVAVLRMRSILAMPSASGLASASLPCRRP